MDITANYHGGADTSVAANASLGAQKARARRQVLTSIATASGGATCEEVERSLGMSHQTASARCTELLADGLIVDTGRRRRTASGRAARVYEVRTMEQSA
jgi:predicted transcriptional regulator